MSTNRLPASTPLALTATGAVRVAVLPSPSCPAAFSPQQ
jgi:hypothetical protein